MGKKAVGVQLDKIAHVLDLFEKIGKIGVEKRLPARDTDTVQNAATLGKISQGICFGIGLGQGGFHKSCIVAEGTSKITAAEKKNGGGTTRIV